MKGCFTFYHSRPTGRFGPHREACPRAVQLPACANGAGIGCCPRSRSGQGAIRWTDLRTRKTMKNFEIVAHRGIPNEAPENTVASFNRAVELGADAIEFDVRL